MIQNVEGLPSDLHALAVAHLEVLQHREVRVEEVGTVQDVTSGVAGCERDEAVLIVVADPRHDRLLTDGMANVMTTIGYCRVKALRADHRIPLNN